MSDDERGSRTLIHRRSALVLVVAVLVVSVVILGAVFMGGGQEEPSTQDADVVEWTHTIDTGYPSTSPTAVNGTVYFVGATENDTVKDPEEGAKNISVYAVDAETGEEIWKFDIGKGFLPPVPFTVSNGTVYVGGSEIYALDAETGRERWKTNIIGSGINRATVSAVVQGTVYGFKEKRIYAFEATTGREEWNLTLSKDVPGFSLAASGDTVYAGIEYSDGSPASILAINSSTTEPKWNYTTNEPVWHPPRISHNTVYAQDYNGIIYSLNAETGKEEWKFNVRGNISIPPSINDKKVYASGNSVYALDAVTGEEEWKFKTEPQTDKTYVPTVADGMVYAGHPYTEADVPLVYALNAETGELNWKVATGEKMASLDYNSADFSDGTLYVGATGGTVYALNVTALENGEKTSYNLRG